MATALQSQSHLVGDTAGESNIYARLNAFPPPSQSNSAAGPSAGAYAEPLPHTNERTFAPPLSAPPRMDSPSTRASPSRVHQQQQQQQFVGDYGLQRQSYIVDGGWVDDQNGMNGGDPAFAAPAEQTNFAPPAQKASPTQPSQRASQHENMANYVFPPPNGAVGYRRNNMEDSIARGQHMPEDDMQQDVYRNSAYLVEQPPPQQQYRGRSSNPPRRPPDLSFSRSDPRPPPLDEHTTPDESLYTRPPTYYDQQPRPRSSSAVRQNPDVYARSAPNGDLNPRESIPEESYANAYQPVQPQSPRGSYRQPAHMDDPQQQQQVDDALRHPRVASPYGEYAPSPTQRPASSRSRQPVASMAEDDPYARVSQYRDRPPSMIPQGSARHPSVPGGSISGPIVPMSAGPAAAAAAVQQQQQPKLRTSSYAQQPTYVTTSVPAGNAAAVYTPVSPKPVSQRPSVPPEEVCVECAMRDQDMADVDVTGPGVWERESDVAYAELLRRELDEEAAGVPMSLDPAVPRARGDLLTEHHLKIWLAINPKEPQARQQTLNAYVKSQRALFEAEALAQSRAIAESRSLENRMRETYSQLRRSAYEAGGPLPVDESGGLRIKSPRSLSISQGVSPMPPRDATLLANGLIVEYMDVRREEKEEKERRKREEKRSRSRARKSSRGSGGGADVQSVYSVASPAPHTDSGFTSGQQPISQRQSQFSLTSSQHRPVSAISNPLSIAPERPGIPRAYSQYSLSESVSMSVSSPRRSRFFGKALSPGWKSQDSLAPSGISGSMVDMHVALDRAHHDGPLPGSRLSEAWRADDQLEAERVAEEKATKKRKGLLKIWKIVTGASKHDTSTPRGGAAGSERARSVEHKSGTHSEDVDAPLAPPPPLSYLVSRGTGEGPRHQSASSVSSANYVMPGMSLSPNTAPSSTLPSPVSSRKSGPDGGDAADGGTQPMYFDRNQLMSEPDRESRASVLLGPATTPMKRDKSLPPLPHEVGSYPSTRAYTMSDARPATMFYDSRGLLAHDVGNGVGGPSGQHNGGLLAPNAPFRTMETRRQSFGGMSSRPDLGYNTLPVSAGYAQNHFSSAQYQQSQYPQSHQQPNYGEFGMASRHSLGRFDTLTPEPSSSSVAGGTLKSARKRRSKFGLSSLFGRKSSSGKDAVPVPAMVSPVSGGGNGPYGPASGGGAYEFPVYAPSSSEDEYARRTRSPNATMTRMSVASRKAIEELVDQDRDFVAYRYPSHHDQALMPN